MKKAISPDAKTEMFKLRMTKEEREMLSKISKLYGLSQSEMVRSNIRLIYRNLANRKVIE